MKFKGISIEKAENVLSVRGSDTFGLVRGRLDALDAVLTKMSYAGFEVDSSTPDRTILRLVQQFKASAVALFDAVTITQCEEVLERASSGAADTNACSEREFARTLATTVRRLLRDAGTRCLIDKIDLARRDVSSMSLSAVDVRVLDHFMHKIENTVLDGPIAS